jgi:hypothetical protein
MIAGLGCETKRDKGGAWQTAKSIESNAAFTTSPGDILSEWDRDPWNKRLVCPGDTCPTTRAGQFVRRPHRSKQRGTDHAEPAVSL